MARKETVTVVKDLTGTYFYTEEDDEQIVTGREIYEEHMMSGLNRIPITILSSFILAGVDLSVERKFPIQEIVERLLVDGSVFAYKGELQDCVVVCEKNFVRQELGDDVVREFSLLESGKWRVRDLKEEQWNSDLRYGVRQDEDEDERDVVEDYGEVSAEAVFVYPNGLGVLFWAQKQCRALERKWERLDLNMAGSALSNIITNFYGNQAQAERELAAGKRNVFIPGKNVAVQKVGSTSHSDQLMREFEGLLPLYMQHLHIVDTADGVNTSGVSRKLKMGTMLQFVDVTRNHVKAIYKEEKTKIIFDNLQVMDATERRAEAEFLDYLVETAGFDPVEAAEKKKSLAI